MSLSFCNTIKAFDNSTLYTTIPHSKLQDIKGVGPNVFHDKRMAKVDTNAFAMLCGRIFQQTSYLWVQTVLLFSSTYSFIRTSYTGFSGKAKRS